MKYIVDTDALIDSLECIRVINLNGDLHVSLGLVQEFIRRFPKDPVDFEVLTVKGEILHD